MKKTVLLLIFVLNFTVGWEYVQTSASTLNSTTQVLLIAKESSFDMQQALADVEASMMRSILEDADYKDMIPDGIYKGSGVVQDRYLITSGTCPMEAAIGGRPDGTPELTQKLIDLPGSADNQSYQATAFTAIDTQTMINPGIVEILKGQTIIKAMTVKFQYTSDEPRCNGLGTLSPHNAILDTLGQGPVWGNFTLNGEGCIWEGTYYGYREITGVSEWTCTIQMTGKERGGNSKSNNFFAVEIIRSNVPSPVSYPCEAKGYIIEPSQSGQENVLKATPFTATEIPTAITDPGTTEILNGRTIIKDMKVYFNLNSQEARCNGTGLSIHNVIIDSLMEGPVWGVTTVNTGGGTWSFPHYGLRINSGTTVLINFAGSGSGGDIEGLTYIGTITIHVNSDETWSGEWNGYIIEKKHETGIQKGSFVFEGRQRDYIAFLPKNYNGITKLPLVLSLHGYTLDAQQQMNYTGMNTVADTGGFIVVYPNAVQTAWNNGISGGPNVNDVGFIDALIDTLGNHYSIDKTRIYICGLSRGGVMSNILACKLSNKIAAVAAVAGTFAKSLTSNYFPDRHIPILYFHGTSDPKFPYNGDSERLDVETFINHWIRINFCTVSDTIMPPDLNTSDGCTVQKITHTNSLDKTTVVFYKILNGGHTWPGGNPKYLVIPGYDMGNTNFDINASEIMWDFFRKYKLTEPSLTNWKLKAPMPTLRGFTSGAVVDGKIYMIGGFIANHVVTPANEMYDPALDNWTPKQSMPKGLCAHATCTYDGKIYVFGGVPSNPYGPAKDSVYIYDPSADTWSTKKDMPHENAFCGVAVVQDTIYLIGGMNVYNGAPDSTVMAYYPATDSWSEKAPMPTPRGWLSACVVDGKIYAIGGTKKYNSSGYNIVEVYDPSTNTWTRKTDMPTARVGLAGCVVDGKIYMVGGFDSQKNAVYTTTEIYDPASDKWKTGPPLNEKRFMFFLGSVGNKIYAIGGSYPDASGTNPILVTSVEEYDVSTVEVKQEANHIPDNAELSQNYPNPFNPSTKIQYAIRSKQLVTLKIYDLLGRQIATLVNEEKPAGTYEVIWNVKSLPSGVYFYQIKAGKFFQTKKMILLK